MFCPVYFGMVLSVFLTHDYNFQTGQPSNKMDHIFFGKFYILIMLVCLIINTIRPVTKDKTDVKYDHVYIYMIYTLLLLSCHRPINS